MGHSFNSLQSASQPLDYNIQMGLWDGGEWGGVLQSLVEIL